MTINFKLKCGIHLYNLHIFKSAIFHQKLSIWFIFDVLKNNSWNFDNILVWSVRSQTASLLSHLSVALIFWDICCSAGDSCKQQPNLAPIQSNDEVISFRLQIRRIYMVIFNCTKIVSLFVIKSFKYDY